MKNILVIFLFLILIVSCSQDNPKVLVDSFVKDLKDKHLNVSELIDKFFAVSENISSDKKQEHIVPILTEQISIVREKLISECDQIEIVDFNHQSALVKSLKLDTANLNIHNVYYIVCNDSIVIPVLTDGFKILSIMTYSKTENGTEAFITFD